MKISTSAKKNTLSQSRSSANKQSAFQFVDNRPEASTQRKLIEATNTPSFISPDNSQAVIQRYTILNPADYQIQDDGQNPMFPSNQLENRDVNTFQGGVKSVTRNLKWVERLSANPPLKVSENGLLALESTVGQPRVFYGDPGKVQEFRQRLINIKSRITLQQVGGSTVTTPSNPVNPDGQTQNLVQVEPVRNTHIPMTEELMSNSVCTEVSNMIVGGKNLVIGGKKGSEKVLGKVTLGNTSRFGKMFSNLSERGTTAPEDFEQEWENDQDPINVNDTTLPISEGVSKYFENGFFTRKHLMPGQQVLRALSIQGIPKRMWKQVFELYVGKSEQQRPEEDIILSHIKGYFKVQDTISYRGSKEDQQMKTDLGINEMANPEVGESFSTFSQIAPSTMDKDGVVGHGVDLSNMNNYEIKTLINGFLELKNSAQKLGILAKSEYKKAKGLVQFGEHHAAVVAKDGADSITFENYNRGEESNTLQSELWESWFRRSYEFDESVKDQVRIMLNEVRMHEQNPDYNNFDKQFMVLRSKKMALREFQQGFIDITDQVRATLDKNIEEDMNSLWHFNMYGPANQTFTDEKGKVRGQSFHDTWSSSVPNAITLRTTALVTDEMRANLRKKVYNILYQMVLGDNFVNPLSAYDEIRDSLLENIKLPKTRIEYSDLLIVLEEQEQTGGLLNPSEQLEAEALFTGRQQLLFTVLFLLKNRPQDDPKRQFFSALYKQLTAVNDPDDESDGEWD